MLTLPSNDGILRNASPASFPCDIMKEIVSAVIQKQIDEPLHYTKNKTASIDGTPRNKQKPSTMTESLPNNAI